MNRVHIKLIDTFTGVPHLGNPAGAVLDAHSLTKEQMFSIARELHVSETGFVLPPSDTHADLQIYACSPVAAGRYGGHSMYACFHALAEEKLLGMDQDGTYGFKVETPGGLFDIEVVKTGVCSSVYVTGAAPALERASNYKVELVRLLNISIGEFDANLAIQRAGYLYAPIRRLHTVFNMMPNFSAMANFLATRKLDGICIYTIETIDRTSLVHARLFSANSGILEEPVSAFAHAAIGTYLYEKGVVERKDGQYAFQGEQGDEIGRRGRVSVQLLVEGGKMVGVKTGGPAVTSLEGEMRLPE